MAALKPIRPSLKERKRYVIFEVISDKEISQDEVINALSKACLEFMGTLQYGKAGMLALKNQFQGNKGIVRINHIYVDYLKAALMMITEINGKKVNIRVTGVSGILKKARNKFIDNKK
jgi:ribonuclease P/MRP protein subunit POP5